MLKTTLLIASAASMLTACACGTSAMPVSTPPPANLTQPCPILPSTSAGTLPELIRNHQAITSLYHECRKRQSGLAEWIQQKETISHD